MNEIKEVKDFIGALNVQSDFIPHIFHLLNKIEDRINQVQDDIFFLTILGEEGIGYWERYDLCLNRYKYEKGKIYELFKLQTL